jgi:hypothetical protein
MNDFCPINYLFNELIYWHLLYTFEISKFILKDKVY